ncbi:hypothetical protein ACTA71_004890 [Dictyostelium dimigraforme]
MPPNSNLKFEDDEIRIIGPETPLIKKELVEKEKIKIPIFKHKYFKQTILLYIIFFIYVMSTFLYGVIIPNMIVDYVAFKFPSFTFDDQQSKAAYYKSYSDALPNLTMFLFGPLVGVLSDKYGRKKILYLAVFSAVMDMTSCFVSMYTHNLAYYYVFHTLGGINVVMQPAVFSYIADIFDEDDIPILYSFAGAALGIGVVIGPLIFVFISSGSQFVPVYVTGGLMSLCFIGIAILPESLEIAKENNKIQETISTFNPFKLVYNLLKSSGYVFWVILVFASINYTGQDLINDYYYFASLLYGWGSTENGYYLAALGTTIIIWGAFIIPLMLRYYSQRRVITFGYCCSLLAHTFFVFAGIKVKYNFVIFLVGTIFVGFVPNNMNIIQAVISGSTPPSMQGSILTGANAIAGLANFVGSIAANDILMYFSSPEAPIFFPPAIFLINGVVVLITLIGTILIWRAYKNPPTIKTLKEQEQKKKLDSEKTIN